MVSSSGNIVLLLDTSISLYIRSTDVPRSASERLPNSFYILLGSHSLLRFLNIVRAITPIYHHRVLRIHRFHTFCNHSEGLWRLTSHLDHLGIVVVMWGSTIPSDHFGFYCDPQLQYFYKTLVYTLHWFLFPHTPQSNLRRLLGNSEGLGTNPFDTLINEDQNQ